jgi:Bacterial Ig-like domain (group 1)/Carboxypeptidase regulatory-like domain
MKSSWALPAAAAMTVAATACGGDDLCTGGPFCFSPPTRPVPSSIEAGPNAKEGLSAAPGRELPKPMDVVVKDSDGKPVSGVTVNFRVSSGGGEVSSGTAESDVNGLAQVSWTLGEQLGAQGLEAAATNADGDPLANSPLQLSATAVAPQADSLVLRTTLQQEAQNGVPLDPQPVIEVYADGQPLAGIEVVASVSSGGATVSGGISVTSDGVGLATFTNLSLIGPQGPQTLRFSVATPALEVTSGSIQLLAGNATSMEAAGPTSFEGTVNSPVSPGPSVLVRDQAGNPAPGVTVSFTANRNASVSPDEATTNEQGIAQVSWTLGSTANVSYTLTARIESSPIPPVQFSAMARPGNAGRLRIAVQPSSPTVSGTAFATQPVIQLEDPNGNPTPQPGVRVTATISSGPQGTLSNEAATTDGSGRAAFSGLTLSGQVGSYTLTFSASGLVGATSSPFGITAGAPAKLAVITLPSTRARSRAPLVIQPVVQIQDASSNPIRQVGTVVVASLTAPNTSLTGESATTDENGRAVFAALTITGIPGPKDLTFSATGLQSASARVTLVSVETVSAARTHPEAATAGTKVGGPVITWTLRDAATRPVADADFTLIVPSGGTAATLTPFSDANGAVQVGNWTLGATAGYQYLVLRLPDGREFRDSILATPDSPADLIIHSGDGQSAPAGQDLPQPLVVRVVDRFGNGVAGVPVQWATCDGAAGPTVNTDASGFSSVTQPTSQPTESGCTRASIAQPPDVVEFHYTVTGTASQEEPPTGVSAAQSRHTAVPPVRVRQRR